MPEEIEKYVSLMTDRSACEVGGRTYHLGKIKGTEVVIVFSRWGKVAAATTATTLIQCFKASKIVFTGVAGAIDPNIKIGDIVIAKRLIQHDMDARPLMRQFEIPLLGVDYFNVDDSEISIANDAFSQVLSEKFTDKENSRTPKIFLGEIASGDKFFSNQSDKEKLTEQLPSVSCVEMEGAAVAQVCYEYRIPFVVIRVISDEAGNHAEFDFAEFVKQVSSRYLLPFIDLYFEILSSRKFLQGKS